MAGTAAVASLLLVLAREPPGRPCAETDDFSSSWIEKLDSSAAQPASPPRPGVHVASATPGELTAVAVNAETNAARTDPRAPHLRLPIVTCFNFPVLQRTLIVLCMARRDPFSSFPLTTFRHIRNAGTGITDITVK